MCCVLCVVCAVGFGQGLSMAGAGSKGLPNGVPVDEWGIRMEPGSCNPVGANVSRGGATNGPAAVYAIRKWDDA